MKDYIETRVLDITNYMLNSKCTIRDVAKVFKVSKSTVHKDMAERLLEVNPQKALKIKELLELNKDVRASRGGEATKRKYMELASA